MSNHQVSGQSDDSLSDYSLPEGGVGLTGPVERPVPGTLPLRGDLAHIALADRFLAAHYVIPMQRRTGAGETALRLAPRADAPVVIRLAAGTPIELLDLSGDWAWVACGPAGPSGYVPHGALGGSDAP